MPRHRGVLTEAQSRILARLSEFSESLETSWDVPRSLSLPGLAESLGVVRSALHSPLSMLEEEELVFSRNAHVIGGGSRRRTVIHITRKGRQELEESDPIPTKKTGAVFGPIPDSVVMHGRDEDMGHITTSLSDGKSIVLSGLPGIGKSTLAREVSEHFSQIGWTIRWASCNLDCDAPSVGSMWLGDNSPSSSSAISSAAGSGRTLLVVDEAQELHPRHVDGVSQLLNEASSGPSPVLVVVRAPSPFDSLIGFEEYRIGGLKHHDATSLLPEGIDPDTARGITDALGGHPLAIRLWSPDEGLPEKDEAVQEFVQSTVIRRLSDQGLDSLDELSLSPIPLVVSEMGHEEGTSELDDSAVLRWSREAVEPHHLVRNVRRATWSEEEAAELHSAAAERWASVEGPRARRLEAHHRMERGEESDAIWISENIQDISDHDSSAAAILLESAVNLTEDSTIRESAVHLALERGEVEIADLHISELPDGASRKLLSARSSRIKGKASEADKIEQEAISMLEPSERARASISSIVRIYDDRLPGPISNVLSQDLLGRISSVDLSGLPQADVEAATLAMDIIRHGVALASSDLAEASESRASIERRLGHDHPRLQLLDLRSRLAVRSEGKAPLEAIDASRTIIEDCASSLDRIRTIHATLEACGPSPPEWLVEAHSHASKIPLREDIAAFRRLSAQRWYWRGILEPGLRMSHWNEAISRFRKAECNNAANELATRLAKGT